MKRKTLFKTRLGLMVLSAALALQGGRVWVGIGAVAAANGASWQTGAMIGVLGVSDALLYSVAIGTAVGGPAGTVAGAVVGL